MTGRVRLVAMDLDGTLLAGGNRVSEANAAAVRKAAAAGVHIVIATSRWYLLAKHTADELGICSPIICHNGAHVRDPRDGSAWLRLDVPAEPAREIASFGDAQRYEGMVTVDDRTYLISKRRDLDPARLPAGMAQTDRLLDYSQHGAQGFLFFGQDAVDGFKERIGGRFDGVLNMAYGVSETFPPYLNVVHADADKGRALRLVCERLEVPVEASMAIGDAAPDLRMMHAAGIGMAMGNAPEDVKAQADVVGPGNLEDGVAWAIEQYAL